jgi:transcriptional regulator with XRE-family HTH domain
MKKLTDIPTSQLAKALGIRESRASSIKVGRVPPSAKVAQQINNVFGVPLWEIRPDIYPRHLFEANDASNSKQPPQSINEGVHE